MDLRRVLSLEGVSPVKVLCFPFLNFGRKNDSLRELEHSPSLISPGLPFNTSPAPAEFSLVPRHMRVSCTFPVG